MRTVAAALLFCGGFIFALGEDATTTADIGEVLELLDEVAVAEMTDEEMSSEEQKTTVIAQNGMLVYAGATLNGGSDLGTAVLYDADKPWGPTGCKASCLKKVGCEAWTFRERYCYMIGYTRSGVTVVQHPPAAKKKDDSSAVLLAGSRIARDIALRAKRKASELHTDICAKMASPFPDARWRSPTMDAAESAWELARERGTQGDLDLTERRMHLLAVMAPYAFAPYGQAGVPEAEAWKRFDFGKCCSEVDMYMHEVAKENVGNNGGHGVCTPQPWKACADGKGAWEFGFRLRWEGTSGYDKFFLKAFESRRAAHVFSSSNPAYEEARAGTYHGGPKGDREDPVLPARSLLPLFPEIPVGLSGNVLPVRVRESRKSGTATATSPAMACIQLLQHTPTANYGDALTPGWTPPPGWASDEAVSDWLKKIPHFDQGSGWVVNDCFIDRTWGEDFCTNLDPACKQGAGFQHWDAMLHKSSMHCRGYRPFFDISMPLPVDWRWVRPTPHNKGVELRAKLLDGKGFVSRKYLMFFKGSVGAGTVRSDLLKLHDPAKRIIAVDSHKPESAQYDYGACLADSRFGPAPRGAGLDSYRLDELMQYGTIPVIISDGYVLPFASIIDWGKLSISVPEAKITQIEAILLSLDKHTRRRMARHTAFVFEEFMSSKQRIAAVSLAIIERNIDRAKKHFAPQCV